MTLAFFLGLAVGVFSALSVVAGILCWRLMRRTDSVENALKNIKIEVDEGGETNVEKNYRTGE